MPRLFTGLEVPQDIAFELNLMQGGVWGARWIEARIITSRSGSSATSRSGWRREIRLALESVIAEPFTIRLKGVGAFGGSDRTSIHAGVAESTAIRRLQAHWRRHCQMIGLAARGAQVHPHVTLAD